MISHRSPSEASDILAHGHRHRGQPRTERLRLGGRRVGDPHGDGRTGQHADAAGAAFQRGLVLLRLRAAGRRSSRARACSPPPPTRPTPTCTSCPCPCRPTPTTRTTARSATKCCGCCSTTSSGRAASSTSTSARHQAWGRLPRGQHPAGGGDRCDRVAARAHFSSRTITCTRCPALLREAFPDTPILHFTHIPFPDPPVLRLIPDAWRQTILRGMLGADVVGLQTPHGRAHRSCRAAPSFWTSRSIDDCRRGARCRRPRGRRARPIRPASSRAPCAARCARPRSPPRTSGWRRSAAR